MSDPHIEGLRKAARRTFWEARQLEEKAKAKAGEDISDVIAPVLDKYERLADSIRDKFSDCGRPAMEEAEAMNWLYLQVVGAHLLLEAIALKQAGADPVEPFRDGVRFWVRCFSNSKYLPSTVLEMPEFRKLLIDMNVEDVLN